MAKPYVTRATTVTKAELHRDGPPIRLRDLVAVTGLSTDTIRRDIHSGELRAFRRHGSRNTRYLIERADARDWLARMFHVTHTAADTSK